MMTFYPWWYLKHPNDGNYSVPLKGKLHLKQKKFFYVFQQFLFIDYVL